MSLKPSQGFAEAVPLKYLNESRRGVCMWLLAELSMTSL